MGNMIIVMFADDIVGGFDHEGDARFGDAMRKRLEEFSLGCTAKTHLLKFGRFAAARRAAYSL